MEGRDWERRVGEQETRVGEGLGGEGCRRVAEGEGLGGEECRRVAEGEGDGGTWLQKEEEVVDEEKCVVEVLGEEGVGLSRRGRDESEEVHGGEGEREAKGICERFRGRFHRRGMVGKKLRL